MPFERIGNAVVLSAGTAGDQFMSDATQLANGDIIAVWCDGDLSALDPPASR